MDVSISLEERHWIGIDLVGGEENIKIVVVLIQRVVVFVFRRLSWIRFSGIRRRLHGLSCDPPGYCHFPANLSRCRHLVMRNSDPSSTLSAVDKVEETLGVSLEFKVVWRYSVASLAITVWIRGHKDKVSITGGLGYGLDGYNGCCVISGGSTCSDVEEWLFRRSECSWCSGASGLDRGIQFTFTSYRGRRHRPGTWRLLALSHGPWPALDVLGLGVDL